MKKRDTYLDDGLRGWITNTARKEHWRMASWYSFEDLEQDGYLAYAKCWNKYQNIFDVAEPTKTQRKWFMALVQRTYYNHIMTLASRFAKRAKETAMSQMGDEETSWELVLPAVLPDATLMCALAKLPAELSDVLVKILQDGADTGKYLRKRIVGAKNRATVRETTQEYWARVLGQPDVPERFADYIRT